MPDLRERHGIARQLRMNGQMRWLRTHFICCELDVCPFYLSSPGNPNTRKTQAHKLISAGPMLYQIEIRTVQVQ